jgi:hypothetical protein
VTAAGHGHAQASAGACGSGTGDATGGPMTGRRFEFRVQGPLSESARHEFYGLSVTDAPQETIISGEVIDESHLHGILALVRSLDLHLISMHEVPG